MRNSIARGVALFLGLFALVNTAADLELAREDLAFWWYYVRGLASLK